jgi:glycosyltransferase 2 family protein
VILQASLGLTVGVALIAAVVSWAGRDEVLDTLASGDRGLLLAAFVLFATQTITMPLRWWLALRMLGHKVRFISILRANCVSNVVNFFAPGHFGEPLVAAWLARAGRAAGVESFGVLIASKAVATILNLVILLACLPLLAVDEWKGSLARTAAVSGLLVVVATVGLAGLLHPAPTRWATARLEGRGPRAHRLQGWMRRFRATLAVFARRGDVLAAVLATSALKVVAMVGAFALIYAAYGAPVGFAGALFLEAMDALGGILAVWIPANLGVQEAIQVSAAAGGLAVDPAIAAAASLTTKGVLIAHVALGGLIALAAAPWDPVSSSPPDPTEDPSADADAAPADTPR